jgi:nicotinamidase-related amidase
MAARRSLQARALAYVEGLEANKRYVLCVWPPHCVIGTEGHAIYTPLREALYLWEQSGNLIDFVTKGSNFLTEHYSAVRADVPDASDPTTQLNTGLINTLVNCDYLLISGEALSHCLASTVRDIADNVSPDLVKKFVLLEDTSHPVKGFEQLAEDFLKDMKSRGMQISNTKNFF